MKHYLKENLLILIFGLFTLALHLSVSLNYGMHRDEYLYMAFSRHLDWGYFSVPPLIGVFSKLIDVLFGASVFGIRFFPALTGALTVMLIGLITKRMGGKNFAVCVASLAYILSPSYLRVNTLFQPVTFEQFFWILAMYWVIRLIQDKNPKYWLWFGFIIGIALLNKYLIALYVVSLVIAFLLVRERTLLFSRYFVFAVGIGLIVVTPNLIWQYEHLFPVVSHLSELNSSQLVNVRISGFLFFQLGQNYPGIVVWLFGLIGLFVSKHLRPYRVIGLSFAISLLLLVLLKGKGYYSLGLYLPLFAAGACLIEIYWERRLALKYALFAFMFLNSLLLLPYSIPVLSFPSLERYARVTGSFLGNLPLIWEDGKAHPIPQDFADMTGWDDVGKMTVKAYHSLDKETRKNCMIYGDNYGQAGSVLYASRGQNIPEPVSFSDNFMLWAPDSTNAKTLLYIDDEIDDMKPLFAKVDTFGTIHNKYFRENGISVFILSGPKEELRRIYARKVADIKKRYWRER